MWNQNPFNNGIFYGSDLDALLAVSGAEPYYGAAAYGGGAEIYGAAAYGAGMEIYGVDPYAYGAAAYGAVPGGLPSRASAPHWMHRPAAPHPMHHAHPHGAPPPGVSPRGIDVKMNPGVNARRFPLGFASAATIAAAAASTVTAQPQVPYRPEKLVVPSDIAGSFDITDVKVGKDSQFVAAGAIPARAFTETAVDNLLSFHGVAVSQIVSIAVVNTGGAALTFKALMVGTAVE